jgi:uncharacterized protein YjbI with pentapeptide repeats
MPAVEASQRDMSIDGAAGTVMYRFNHVDSADCARYPIFPAHFRNRPPVTGRCAEPYTGTSEMYGTDLQGADLRYANLDGAQLSGANLGLVGWQGLTGIKDQSSAA